MGYIAHHAIIVTVSDYDGHAKKVHTKATSIFKSCWVSPLSPRAMNGYYSFLVAPDGSKEGWQLSNVGEEERTAFIEWLYQYRYDDGSGPADWVEVFYSPDDREAKVERHCYKTKNVPKGILK